MPGSTPPPVDDQGYGSQDASDAPLDLGQILAGLDQGSSTIGYGSGLAGIGNAAQAGTPIQFTSRGGAFGSFAQTQVAPSQPFTITGKPYSVTYQQIVDSIRSSRDRQSITAMQRQLFDAGMYDDSFYNKPAKGKAQPQPAWGYVDAPTLDALNSALGYSAVRNMPLENALAESTAVHRTNMTRQQQAEDAAKRNENPPQVYFAQGSTQTVPDADAVALVVDAAAQQLIGREVTPEEKSQIVSSIMAQSTALAQQQGAADVANSRGIGEAQAAEYQYQVAAINAEQSGGPSPAYTPPAGAQVIGAPGSGQTYITGGGVNVLEGVDPQAEAAKQIEDKYANEAKQYKMTQQFNVLLRMIGGGGGQQ